AAARRATTAPTCTDLALHDVKRGAPAGPLCFQQTRTLRAARSRLDDGGAGFSAGTLPRQQPLERGQADELGGRVHAQLAVDVRPVGLHGLEADAKRLRDVAAREARADPPEGLPSAPRALVAA